MKFLFYFTKNLSSPAPHQAFCGNLGSIVFTYNQWICLHEAINSRRWSLHGTWWFLLWITELMPGSSISYLSNFWKVFAIWSVTNPMERIFSYTSLYCDGDINRNFKMMPLCNFLIWLLKIYWVFLYWYVMYYTGNFSRIR